MRLPQLSLAFVVGACVTSGAAFGGVPAWPQFRGPGGAGVATTGDFPTFFGPESNVVWKTALPPGNSSPCIWAERIFLTAFADGKLTTLCLDRRDGRILWRQTVEPGRMERGGLGTPADSTPATDGRRVFVYFASFGLLCYDFAGQEQWRKPLPTPVTQHGAATSPVLAGDRLLLACDQDVGSHLLAVHCRNGETAWKVDRSSFRRGFATPLIWPQTRPRLAILPGTLRLVAYDLKDGTERWAVRGLPNEMVASPVSGDGLVFVAGWTPGAGVSKVPTFDSLLERDQDHDGRISRDEAPPGPAQQQFAYIDANKDGFITREEWDSMARVFDQSENALLAVRPGGRGDVTATHVAWKQKRGLPYVPSPLWYEGRVYVVKTGGLASCFEAQTGKVCYQEERLGALGDYYASPVAAHGKICAASQPGVVVIYRAGDTLAVLACNKLDGQILATPAIVQDTLYVRTRPHLYAFGTAAPLRTRGPER